MRCGGSAGLVVLHDFVLHHLIAGLTLGRGDTDGYLDAMQRDAGVIGRLLAHGVVDHLLPPIWEERAADFPLAGEVLDRADGLICHSQLRRAARPGVRLRRADLGRPDAGLALGGARRAAGCPRAASR